MKNINDRYKPFIFVAGVYVGVIAYLLSFYAVKVAGASPDYFLLVVAAVTGTAGAIVAYSALLAMSEDQADQREELQELTRDAEQIENQLRKAVK